MIVFRRGQELRRYLFEHPAGGCRFHDPAADFLPPQHHRHPGMNPTHGLVGLSGQNAVAALILLLLVDARQIERLRVRQSEQILSLICTPLIKAAGRDDAAAHLHAASKQRLFLCTFRPGVDNQRLLGLKAPAHEVCFNAALPLHQNRSLQGRPDFTRRPCVPSAATLHRLNDFLKFRALLRRELISPTHKSGEDVLEIPP
ncbi:hypothetical protein SDC9_72995 [bioreactor metagenome]|uniref:Uncharacterized protein n=1 Tax=bioreactor metagenome TaxID=1076179 RepID=A0A644YCW8_9ZZZZ